MSTKEEIDHLIKKINSQNFLTVALQIVRLSFRSDEMKNGEHEELYARVKTGINKRFPNPDRRESRNITYLENYRTKKIHR